MTPTRCWTSPIECLVPSSNNMIVRSSVGAGLIWSSPFGPLRFDFAFPVTKASYDRSSGSASEVERASDDWFVRAAHETSVCSLSAQSRYARRDRGADRRRAGRSVAAPSGGSRARGAGCGRPAHLTFVDGPKYLPQLENCHAGACFVSARLEQRVPARTAALRVADPYRAFVTVARKAASRRAASGIVFRATLACRRRRWSIRPRVLKTAWSSIRWR